MFFKGFVTIVTAVGQTGQAPCCAHHPHVVDQSQNIQSGSIPAIQSFYYIYIYIYIGYCLMFLSGKIESYRRLVKIVNLFDFPPSKRRIPDPSPPSDFS